MRSTKSDTILKSFEGYLAQDVEEIKAYVAESTEEVKKTGFSFMRERLAEMSTETEFDDQVSMLDMTAQNIRLALEQMNVETMTPIEAMNELYKLKKLLD